jgi:hypothetical protein
VSKQLSALWTVVLPLAYVGVSVVMWVVAFNLDDDKAQAAMIGAASAFSVGGAAVIGGGFNAWRTSRMEQARKEKEQRQDAYVRLLGALADYSRACADVRDYKRTSDEYERTSEAPSSSEEDKYLLLLSQQKLVAANEHAREVKLGLEQAFAAVELVATKKVLPAMASLKECIDAAQPGEAIIDRSEWVPFVAKAREELGFEA